MRKTAELIVTTFLGFLGLKEYPAGSNNVIFNTHYYGREVSGDAYPWCCTSVWDVFRICGASELFFGGEKTAYCPSVESWGRKSGLVVPVAEARRGDIVLYDWNHNGVADHIGIIVANHGDGVLESVEGNTSLTSNDNGGAVMCRTRNATDVCCVIRPRYEEEEMDKKEVEALIDEKIKAAVGPRIDRFQQVPEALKQEVRQLLDCGVINGGTPYETDPDDIHLSYDVLRSIVVSKRYTEMKAQEG